jgi:2'-hydroxyisoflavone reductase
MRVLVIGGTSFVGRAISWSAWHHGHDVTVFNRGVTPSDLPDTVERLLGDRSSDLTALEGREFDATIDVTAYRPSDVERLAAALGDRGGHYVQISSISSYADPGRAGVTETTAVLHGEEDLDLEGPITGASYGPLKAASERAGHAFFGDEISIVRPTFVIGSFDSTLRFPYWVERARRGGEIAVPGPRDIPMQYIDARDLANFVVHVVDERLIDSFHVAGPQQPDQFVAMVEKVVEHVAPPDTSIRVIDPEAIANAHLRSKFPLWTQEIANILAVDSSFAFANGLQLRPLSDSVDDVVEWWGERAWPNQWLSAEEESQLLAN